MGSRTSSKRLPMAENQEAFTSVRSPFTQAKAKATLKTRTASALDQAACRGLHQEKPRTMHTRTKEATSPNNACLGVLSSSRSGFR